MRRDNELRLRIFLQISAQQQQQRQLTLRRQRRLRLIHQVETFVGETVLEQREERLPMRLLVQRLSAVRHDQRLTKKIIFRRFRVAIDVRRQVEEAFRPQKISPQ